ncbi:uncharacterized protein LOC122622110 [Drosophila teissieri]|uniref:uncharacterized protein LOC122622110 n=1 Tax=Drosophila teissieri TaxID=7243 RepID=UPI001CB9ED43|nr:uncharacterized protein LOC122622110 [Drosophila teissieri]
MSARCHFGIILVLYCISLCYSYRVVENDEDLKTCPAINKDIIFEEPHMNNNHREIYNVYKIPRRHHFNSNKHEIQPENWLLRIIRIKTINDGPSPKVPEAKEDKHMDGLAKRLFNILRQTLKMEEPSYKHKNEHKSPFLFKENPFPSENHIVKREPLQYNYM